MIKVVFVRHDAVDQNDTPAPINKSFARLIKWINYINPDYYTVVNIARQGAVERIERLYRDQFKVVCVGIATAAYMPSHINYIAIPTADGPIVDIAALGIALGRAKDHVQCIF